MKSLRFSLSILLGASETFFCFSAASVLGSSLFPAPVLVEEGLDGARVEHQVTDFLY